MNKHIGAVILAGGKGKRMQSKDVNKVALLLGEKPLIRHSVERLVSLDLGAIVVVVGFAEQSVKDALSGMDVVFATQEEQLGTAHALSCGIAKLPSTVTHVLVIQGDDSAFYPTALLVSLIEKQRASNGVMTFLTIAVDNPQGLGRILRDASGTIQGVVEEKDATTEQKTVTEINPACYIFSLAFLKTYLPKIQKSPVTGEYYLTSLIDMAITAGLHVDTVQGGKLPWRGVNTREELEEAEQLFVKTQTL